MEYSNRYSVNCLLQASWGLCCPRDMPLVQQGEDFSQTGCWASDLTSAFLISSPFPTSLVEVGNFYFRRQAEGIRGWVGGDGRGLQIRHRSHWGCFCRNFKGPLRSPFKVMPSLSPDKWQEWWTGPNWESILSRSLVQAFVLFCLCLSTWSDGSPLPTPIFLPIPTFIPPQTQPELNFPKSDRIRNEFRS